jgi:hypothetical protein
VAGVLGGVLFVVWGYIDRPNLSENREAVVHILSIVVPTLFLVAVVGLCVLQRRRLGVLGWMGLVLNVYGWGWSAAVFAVGKHFAWVFFAQRWWSHYLHDWLALMVTGLILIGIATARGKPLGRMGASAVATGAFGWVYYLTDAGAVSEARSVHVGFGLLFSLGWVALGAGLLAAEGRRAQSPQARR